MAMRGNFARDGIYSLMCISSTWYSQSLVLTLPRRSFHRGNHRLVDGLGFGHRPGNGMFGGIRANEDI
jgi:hypothetical protein